MEEGLVFIILFVVGIVVFAIIVSTIVYSAERIKKEKAEELAEIEKQELELEEQQTKLDNIQKEREIIKEIHKEIVYYICPYCNKKYLAELRDCPNCGAQNK